MNLEEFMKLNKEDVAYYDLKDEFYKELYETNYDGITNVDKWLQYRSKANKLGIDCDASRLSIEVFNVILIKKFQITSDVDTQPKSSRKYELALDQENFLRVDTANSMWTLFKVLIHFNYKNQNGQLTKTYAEICKDLQITTNKGLSAQSGKLIGNYFFFIKNEEILCKLNKFAILTHTIGNFLIYPYATSPLNFNQSRGLHSEIKDYLDLTLLSIYYWYINSEIENPLQKVLDGSKDWFHRFGKGLDGWNRYIKKNQLDDFVHKKNGQFSQPKMFWTGHSFTDPDLDKENGKLISKEKLIKRTNCFLDHMIQAIPERSKNIYSNLYK